MRLLLLLSILLGGVTLSAQKKYSEYTDEDRVILLEQKVENNTINIAEFNSEVSTPRKPTFAVKEDLRQLKISLDTAQNFEIELSIFLEKEERRGVINIWGATHPDEKNPKYDRETDIQYQMDLWSDGIYNVLHRFYDVLIGVKGLKRIITFEESEYRLITIRKVNKEVEFYVNKNLILAILPPLDINEIGVNIKNKGIQLQNVKISYLTK